MQSLKLLLSKKNKIMPLFRKADKKVNLITSDNLMTL